MDVGFILSRIIRRSLLLRGVNAIESGKKCSAGSVGDDDVEHRRLDIELIRTWGIGYIILTCHDLRQCGSTLDVFIPGWSFDGSGGSLNGRGKNHIVMARLS